MIRNIFKHLFHRQFFVIAEAADNSITISKGLFKRLDVMTLPKANVFVFWVPAHNVYGFTPNPALPSNTQLCQIQYNEKHRCVGFETLCPSVQKIFFDYNIKADARVKLMVQECKTESDMVWFKICRPNEKNNR